MPSTRCGLSASRSSIASGVPAARAASRSGGVGGQDLVGVGQHRVGGGVQRPVLRPRWSACRACGRRPGPAGPRRARSRARRRRPRCAHSSAQGIGSRPTGRLGAGVSAPSSGGHADHDRSPAPRCKSRIRLLVWATIVYNVIEAAVALTEGARASSTALIGFGLDSVIEVASAAAVAWQFAAARPGAPGEGRTAVRRVLVLRPGRVCRTWSRCAHCRASGDARHSPIGIGLAAVSLTRHAGAGVGAAPRRPGVGLDSRRCPTPSRPCCAATCRRHCWSVWCSTPAWAGRGPTRSPRW